MSEYTNEQLLEAADILDKAHDVILDKGWASDGAQVKFGRRECIESAVNKAAGYLTSSSCFAQELRREKPWLVTMLEGRAVCCGWNDVCGRTEDEVFDRLRSVAKELRESASL